MSQHDMNIANQGFPAFRSDLNNALAALVSTSSGATEPTTMFANQLWYDTTNDKLKIRNEANSGWIEIVSINQTTGVLTTIAGTVIATPTITGAATFAAGTVSLPAITTTGDLNTGIFFPAADTIAFAEGGAEAMRINSSGQVVTTAGTAALPAITTTADTNTGVFFPAADTIAFTEGGVEAVRINSDAQLVSLAGTALLPSLTASGDPNTGVFYPAADTVAITTGGSERLRLASAGQLGIAGANYGTSGQVLTSNGAAAAPSWQTVSGGVTSLTAGSGITVSASTGAVTVSQDFYTGSTVANATYPIGSYLAIYNQASTTPPNANATTAVYSPPSAGGYRFGNASMGTGSVSLTGTWRARGNTGQDTEQLWLVQRTA